MSRPPIEQQITFLYTRDLNKSAHFYENLLGVELWIDQGTCRIYRVCGEAYLGICQSAEGEAQTITQQPNVIFTVVTPQVDEWYQYLMSQGVIFEKAPQLNEKYRIYNCFFRDPDGYLLEIQRFL